MKPSLKLISVLPVLVLILILPVSWLINMLLKLTFGFVTIIVIIAFDALLLALATILSNWKALRILSLLLNCFILLSSVIIIPALIWDLSFPTQPYIPVLLLLAGLTLLTAVFHPKNNGRLFSTIFPLMRLGLLISSGIFAVWFSYVPYVYFRDLRNQRRLLDDPQKMA